MRHARGLACCIAAVSVVSWGCASSPLGQRTRVVELPLAAAQADLEFALRTEARSELMCKIERHCPDPVPSDAQRQFAGQVQRVGSALAVGALARYPAWVARLPGRSGGPFSIALVTGDGAASMSSADGRIAVNAALAEHAPDDRVVAFILAREMSHVLARHHAENASTGFFVSAFLNAVLPGSGIVKALLAAGGSRLATVRNAPAQAREADTMARELLTASGYRLRDVATSVAAARWPEDGDLWSAQFKASSAGLLAVVQQDDAALAALAALKPAPGVATDLSIAAAN